MGGRFTGGQKPKNMKATITRLWKMVGHEQWKLASIFLLSTLGSAMGLIGPLLVGKAIDAMSSANGVDFQKLHQILLWLGLAYGAGALFTWLQEWWIAAVVQRVIMIMRRALFAHIQKLPLSFFDTRTHGEIMSRLSNDVDSVSTMLSSSTTQLFSSLLMVSGSLVMMLVLSPPLTLLTLTTVPVTLIMSSQIAKRSRKEFRSQQANLAELNGHIEEILSGQLAVKAFGQEDHVIEQFEDINHRLRESGRKAQLLSGMVMPILNTLTNIGFLIVVTAGGTMVVKGILTVGVIASFINYSKQFSRPLNEIANLYSTIQSAQASAERVFELMDELTETPDPNDAIPLENPQGHVSFDDVTFGYSPDSPVLKHISLDAPPGRTIALVGPTGAGKTTIVNLLVRFYDPDEGTIKIDGREMKNWTRDSLRTSFGMVLQDTHLFSGTIRENIRYGNPDATDEEVEAAVKAVGADPFIQRLPNGYGTVLGESGSGLSHGQRQLLAIARAVLADPAVLILDEATSSVDTRTEMVLQKAMLHLRKGRTSFIIAHRLSTIRQADEILVIDHGGIIERGTHEELMKKEGFYFSLYKGQF
ncbi:MAG: ABC transporter ATP-binding protein [Thermoclostridium sp.]|nr:ABC transporter ATP-binding protein [Thermoclostridium sp.]